MAKNRLEINWDFSKPAKRIPHPKKSSTDSKSTTRRKKPSDEVEVIHRRKSSLESAKTETAKQIRGAGVIRRRALRILQDEGRPVYLFTLRADELLQLAGISRVTRDDQGDLIGYQRPEVKKHVQNIVEYLDSNGGNVIFPNSIILALSSAVVFHQVRGPRVDDEGLADAGTIELRIPRDDQHKPAWIVDGQQRTMAFTRCKRRDFPVPVSAFVADDIDTQREQFLRINSTKPLPRGLISELLPKINTVLPSNLTARRAPAALCDILAQDPESPFFGLVKRSSSENESGQEIITDTSLIQMLQDSFSPSGCLFSYRNVATGETDFAGVHKLLFMYWRAVQKTFPEAWGKPPTQSRLMHSVGIRAMGKLMDRLMSAVNVSDPESPAWVLNELKPLQSICRWTSGTWEEINQMPWNAIQNVAPHLRMLTNFLIRAQLAGSRREP
jgi:DGQHR domain-containing protein